MFQTLCWKYRVNKSRNTRMTVPSSKFKKKKKRPINRKTIVNCDINNRPRSRGREAVKESVQAK